MKAYNDIIHHETVRVAVLEMAGVDTAMHKSLPAPFQLLIREMYDTKNICGHIYTVDSIIFSVAKYVYTLRNEKFHTEI